VRDRWGRVGFLLWLFWRRGGGEEDGFHMGRLGSGIRMDRGILPA